MRAPAPAADLLDLKFLPAWVTQPAGRDDYSNFAGEETDATSRPERGPRDRTRRSVGPRERERNKPNRGPRRPVHLNRNRDKQSVAPLPVVAVRFIPHAASLENVIAQIKSGSLAYSVFALARLF